MDSNTPQTQFDNYPADSPNSFSHGSPTDEEIRLQAIFRNLLTNAIKFSDQGGEIKICIYRQPGLWEFQVKDKGVGMTEEVQSLVLKIDDRKQKSGTSGEMGSGFGLLLCEDFIQRHGGHLTWESALGEGTTFSFTIPELLG